MLLYFRIRTKLLIFQKVAKELGPKVIFCPGDITSVSDAKNAVELAVKECGSLQGMLANETDVKIRIAKPAYHLYVHYIVIHTYLFKHFE